MWRTGLEVVAVARVLFQDVVPYAVPSSLGALRGPSGGLVELPISAYWGPDRVFDLDRDGDLLDVYQALVRDGGADAQEEFLNGRLLLGVWGRLALPDRCRAKWEASFPKLGAARAGPAR
jgi:hypothetical protein